LRAETPIFTWRRKCAKKEATLMLWRC
jgi:hypothetical protein